MTGLQNLHTHTTYVDGMLSAEEMIEAALRRGCDSIGFSEHSFVSFDVDYSMSLDLTSEYAQEINMLKEKYKDTIEVFLGLEQDYHTDGPPDGLDYVIGTVHYIQKGDRYHTVDNGAKLQKHAADMYFGGDYYTMSEEFFATTANLIEKTNADIVGHFDLIAKYNFDGKLFDERHPRYKSAALCAMDEILKKCRLFEVNTGAMYRYNKPEPYPSVFLLEELYKRGGEVIISSDSHDAKSICYKFDDMCELLKTIGFRYIKRLTKSGFTDVKL